MKLELKMTDGTGKIPVAEMRGYFELAMKNTKRFNDIPLGTMEVNGQFHHYMDPDTDTLWIGFAIGMRCAQRLALAQVSNDQAERSGGQVATALTDDVARHFRSSKWLGFTSNNTKP